MLRSSTLAACWAFIILCRLDYIFTPKQLSDQPLSLSLLSLFSQWIHKLSLPPVVFQECFPARTGQRSSWASTQKHPQVLMCLLPTTPLSTNQTNKISRGNFLLLLSAARFILFIDWARNRWVWLRCFTLLNMRYSEVNKGSRGIVYHLEAVCNIGAFTSDCASFWLTGVFKDLAWNGILGMTHDTS